MAFEESWRKTWRKIDGISDRCGFCGEVYLMKTANQEYCSPSHRVKANIRRKEEREAALRGD